MGLFDFLTEGFGVSEQKAKQNLKENTPGQVPLDANGRPIVQPNNSRGIQNQQAEQVGSAQTQGQINQNREALGRGMANGAPGSEYFQSQLGQMDAIRQASPDAGYRGTNETAFAGMAQDAQGRGANLADYGAANEQRGLGMQSRGSLATALGMAQQAAMGHGPSAAQAQLQAGTDAAARMAMAQAASARGGMARAGAQRQGMMQAGDATQNAAAQAASLRAQEQQQGMQMFGSLGQALSNRDLQAQGLDASMGQFQAQQMQANRNANDQYAMGMYGMGQRASTQQQIADLQAQQNWNSNFQQSQQHKNAMDQGAAGYSQGQGERDTRTAMGFGSTLLAMAPTLFAASDERLKTNIEDGSKDVRTFLDAIGTHKYDYKSDAYGERGKHVSVMAQELEKSDVGKRAVVDTPIGKVVNYGKLLPVTVAAQGDMHKRLKAIEEKLFAA